MYSVWFESANTGERLPGELPVDGDVAAAQEEAGRLFHVQRPKLRFQNEVLIESHSLADCGLCPESVIEVCDQFLQWDAEKSGKCCKFDGNLIEVTDHETAVLNRECKEGRTAWEFKVLKQSGNCNSQRAGLTVPGADTNKSLYHCSQNDFYWHAAGRACLLNKLWPTMGQLPEVNVGDRMGFVLDMDVRRIFLFHNGEFAKAMELGPVGKTAESYLPALCIMPEDQCELLSGAQLVVPEELGEVVAFSGT
eukprot:Hpha_TRINITY_DN11751_c0_g1::TRINITY_DN11751_c0_g1_i1::g.31859::m.31859